MTISTVPSGGDYGFGKEELRKSSRASAAKNQPSVKAQRKSAQTEPSHVESQAVSPRRIGAEAHRA